jgi:hypothetical protein
MYEYYYCRLRSVLELSSVRPTYYLEVASTRAGSLRVHRMFESKARPIWRSFDSVLRSQEA